MRHLVSPLLGKYLLGVVAFILLGAPAALATPYSFGYYTCGVGYTGRLTYTCGAHTGSVAFGSVTATTNSNGAGTVVLDPDWFGPANPGTNSGTVQIPVSWDFTVSQSDNSNLTGTYDLKIETQGNVLAAEETGTFTVAPNGSTEISGSGFQTIHNVENYSLWIMDLNVTVNGADNPDEVTLTIAPDTTGINPGAAEAGVPEPSTFVLISSCLSFGLMKLRRKRS